jgi:hypothetical protein
MRTFLLLCSCLVGTFSFSTFAAELRSTRVSGEGYTTLEDMAVDADGNTYVCGITFSPGSFQGPLFAIGPVNRDGKNADGFLAKVSRSGVVQFVTLFGGGAYDYPRRIAVATNGDIIVCGATASADFPLSNAIQTNSEAWAGFVARFDSSGRNLVFSTFTGGAATALGLGPGGDIFIGGVAEAAQGPGATARFGETSKTRSGYITRLAADGQTLGYSSLIAAVEIAALTVDELGAAYVVGSGYAQGFPIVNGLSSKPFDAYGADAFLLKLSPNGETLVFATLFGGSCIDRARAIKLDAGGNIYVAGTTCSEAFGDLFRDPAEPIDYRDHGFLASFEPMATNILATNFFRSSQNDELTSLAIKADGTVFAGGTIAGANFTPGLPFVAEISASGAVLAQEMVNRCGTLASVSAIGLDSQGLLYAAGRSNRRNDTPAASTFVAKLEAPNPAPQVRLASPFQGQSFAPGEPVQITAAVLNLAGATVRFYDGHKLIGVASNAPFSVTWSNSVRGVHSLSAVAQKAEGMAKSCAVQVRVKRPFNDDFRRRVRLRGERVIIKSSNEGATIEAGERYRSYPADKSVWWTWTAPRDGVFRFSLGTFSVSRRLEVLTGSFIESLESVASVNAYDPATIRMRKDQVFQIAVTSVGAAGRFQFTIEPAETPPNDDFANRIDMGTALKASGTARDATVETGEQAIFPNSGSVWYTWTAPTSGVFEVTCTFEPSASVLGIPGARPFSENLAVFTGGEIAGLIKVGTEASFQTVTFAAIGGESYVLAVGREYGSLGEFELHIEQVSVPANDNFENRAALAGAEVLAQGSTLTATREPGEPGHGRYTNSPSIWWSWTAPTSGLYAVAVSSRGFSFPSPGISGEALVVYSGTSLTALTRVAGASSSQGLLIQASGGETYAIVYAGPAELSITLDIHPTTRPANDNFAEAGPLTGAYAIAAGTTLNSTLETNEPEQSYLGSVWYRWIAPSNGTYAVDTQYVPLAIYTGNTLEELVPVGIGTGSRQILHASGGDEFNIAVLGSSYAQPFVLRVFPVVLPLNDDFANRTVLLGSNLTFLSNGRDSSAEAEEPPHGGYTAENSAWWSWVAPSNGIVALEIDNYSRVGIYTGAELSMLQTVASIAGSRLTFTAAAGTEYAIAIDSPARQNVRLRYVPRPANDHFAEAQSLGGATATIRTANSGASVEPGEPIPGYNRAGKSLWWSFTPSKTQAVLFSTAGSGFYTVLAIYTGSSVSNLTLVASSTGGAPDGRAWLAVRLSAGTQYFILVDGTDPAQFGQIQLALKPVTLPPNDDFAHRLAMRDGNATGWLTGATAEMAEPDFDGVYWPTVWWTWTAPANGTYLIRERSSLSVALFEGDVLSNLASVAIVERPSSFFEPRQYVFHATQGTAYAVRVSSWFGTVANVDLSIGHFPAGNNDAFANRTRLEPWDTLSTSWNFEATTEPGEPALGHGAGRTLWWQWTAPGSVSLRIDPTSSDIPCVVEVYTGTGLTDLTPVSLTTTGVTGVVSLSATQGQTYFIRVDGDAAATEQRGRIELRTQIVYVLPPRPVVSTGVSSPVQMVRRFDGLIEFKVSAASGDVIETSTNLFDWIPFATNQMPGQTIVVPTQGEGQRFFRVR